MFFTRECEDPDTFVKWSLHCGQCTDNGLISSERVRLDAHEGAIFFTIRDTGPVATLGKVSSPSLKNEANMIHKIAATLWGLAGNDWTVQTPVLPRMLGNEALRASGRAFPWSVGEMLGKAGAGWY